MNDPRFPGAGGMLDGQIRRSLDRLPDRDLVDALVRRGWSLLDTCAWWEAEYDDPRRVLVGPKPGAAEGSSQDRGPT